MDGKKRRRRLFYFMFSLAVTIGVFYYLLTHVSLHDILSLIRGADSRGIMMFVVLSLSMSLFRAWRYKLLLESSGYRPKSLALFLVVIVRNFFSDLLPARVGTLIYVYLVTTRLGIPFSASLSSFALSFLLDIVALAPIVFLSALHLGVSAELSRLNLVLGGVILTVLSIGLLCLLPRIVEWVGMITARINFIGKERSAKIRNSLSATAVEVRKVKKQGIYLRLFVLSVLIRITKYAGLYFFLFALIAPLGYGFHKLGISRIVVGLCSSELAASLPFSGIAGFGAYEGAWVVVFRLLGFPAEIARLTGISHHLFTQVYGYLLGVIALLVLLLPFFKRDTQTHGISFTPTSAFIFYGKVCVITVLIAFCLVGFYLWG